LELSLIGRKRGIEMKPMKILGLIFAIVGVILGAFLYMSFQLNQTIFAELFYQIMGGAAIVLGLVGLLLLIWSRGKTDPLEEAFKALTGKANGIKTDAPASMTFEEEMALRKKQYYDSLQPIQVIEPPAEIIKRFKAGKFEESADGAKANNHLPHPLSGPAPAAPSAKPVEKVKVKFELPFGKKKDRLREMLDEEEKKEEPVQPWKSH
jgi:hypothetical protein